MENDCSSESDSVPATFVLVQDIINLTAATSSVTLVVVLNKSRFHEEVDEIFKYVHFISKLYFCTIS